MGTNENLGEAIKAALRLNKITQDALAEMLGVSRQTVNNHLSKAKIDKDFLQELKEKTGLDYTNYYAKAPTIPTINPDTTKKGGLGQWLFDMRNEFYKKVYDKKYPKTALEIEIDMLRDELDNMEALLKKEKDGE